MTQNLIEKIEATEQHAPLQHAPLAERMRPQRLQDLLGQEELLAPAGALGRIIAENAPLPSMILWGPPGCGKTTLAQLLAKYQKAPFESISAVFGGVAELRQIFARAKSNSTKSNSQSRFVLFVDEIHHFSRAQQEAFLPVVERGTITLIGATTENPSFALRAALLSRCRVFVLKALSEEALEALLKSYESASASASASGSASANAKTLPLTSAARQQLLDYAEGDARTLLNSVEVIMRLKISSPLEKKELAQILQRRSPIYDKNQEAHYNLISALHKAIRGSDCDAALYWLARMLVAGEKPLFIARRLIRIAYEDIGLADPQAAQQTLIAWQVYERLGSPEGELALFSAVAYLATCPKSNAIYKAETKATAAAKKNGAAMPPQHAVNAPTELMKNLGYAKGYEYDHNNPLGFSAQNYFPADMPREQYYSPSQRGFEREVEKRLKYWQKLRDGKQQTEGNKENEAGKEAGKAGE